MYKTTRISAKSRDIIEELGALNGKSEVEIIESALELYNHYERMRALNKGYQKLRQNKKAWKEELQERRRL